MSESNCCSAEIYENTDICSRCKEHCDGIEVFCNKCDWEGKEDDLIEPVSYVGSDYCCPKCHSEDLGDV